MCPYTEAQQTFNRARMTGHRRPHRHPLFKQVFMIEPAMHRDNRPAIAYTDWHNMDIGVIVNIILDKNALTYRQYFLDKIPRNHRFFHNIKHDTDITGA